MMLGKPNTLCKKEANLIKQKCMTQTVAQNIKKQLKSSTENEKIDELERTPMHGRFYQTLKDRQ
jgi:hypothetical protein